MLTYDDCPICHEPLDPDLIEMERHENAPAGGLRGGSEPVRRQRPVHTRCVADAERQGWSRVER